MLCTCVRARALASSSLGSLWNGCVQIWKQGGWRAFYRGLNPSIMHSIVFFYGKDILESSRISVWVDEKLQKISESQQFSKFANFATHLAIVFAKVTLLALVTCPIKSIAVKMQISAVSNSGEGIVSILNQGKLFNGFFSDVLFGFGSFLLTNMLSWSSHPSHNAQ